MQSNIVYTVLNPAGRRRISGPYGRRETTSGSTSAFSGKGKPAISLTDGKIVPH